MAQQLDIPAGPFARYACRPQTVTDHARKLAAALRRPHGLHRTGGEARQTNHRFQTHGSDRQPGCQHLLFQFMGPVGL